MTPEEERYEYQTVHIIPGVIVWDYDLNPLANEGYRLVAVVPLTQFIYEDGKQIGTANGSSLIFERRKEIE